MMASNMPCHSLVSKLGVKQHTLPCTIFASLICSCQILKAHVCFERVWLLHCSSGQLLLALGIYWQLQLWPSLGRSGQLLAALVSFGPGRSWPCNLIENGVVFECPPLAHIRVLYFKYFVCILGLVPSQNVRCFVAHQHFSFFRCLIEDLND